jgi:putative ABC transport system ATP-binding protein
MLFLEREKNLLTFSENGCIIYLLAQTNYEIQVKNQTGGIAMFLEISDIRKHFGEGDSRVDVLKGIHAEIEKGEICVLLGPSGSGKSTLLNIIGGIDKADSGYIRIDGEKMENMNEKTLTRYRRKHLGYIFQMYNLIPNLNIKENVEIGAYLSDNPLDVDDLLKTLGLYEHRHKLPNQLSGGQQQRTAIGRAIVKNPDILLCDEPTGALDYKTSKEILKLIEDINRKYGNTVIMVTHNDAIKNMADRVIKLRDGVIRKNYQNETKTPAAELDW